jgi:hypothetical protein
MKKIFYISILSLFLIACGSSKKATKTSEDKTLLTALKKLDKDPSNTELKNTVTALYNEAAQSHLEKIEIYNTLTEADKWNKIIKEYEALNMLYQTVGTSAAAKIVKAQSYTSELQKVKLNAAEAYYNIGVSELEIGDKQSARKAWYAFRKTNDFVPGYKDVRTQMNIAYENSIVKVVINPIRDNTFFYNSMGWNNYENNYNNDYFQRSLVGDLGGNYNKTSPALFYTNWEAGRENIVADIVVDLTWQYINIPQPMSNQFSRTVSKQIESGRDTSGKIRYTTVTATLYITRKYFTASADMELRITDVNSGNIITNNRYSEQFNWQEEYATYNGDSRALSHNEYALLNNNNYRLPRNEDIVTELSRRIYPQIKNRIASVVNW